MMGNPMNHSSAFMRRRVFNWVPLGVTYALLYMGRYNLTVAKIAFGDLMTKADFGIIFAIGTITYAFAFIINGPMTDKIGGRKAMLLSASGAGVANALMGFFTYTKPETNLVLVFSILYAINMYFQSFGAVSIVKVNSHWFHVRERGMFGGIFGILISTGIFFAFQIGQFIVNLLHTTTSPDGTVVVSAPYWVFWIPSVLLFIFVLINYLMVQDSPSKAGMKDIETGDASSGEDDKPDPIRVILKKVVTNPVVITIGAIEFCTGVLRQGIMHWYPIFAKDLGYYKTFFVTQNWGSMLFLAGATGGMTAGWISDKVFGSRRGPVAGLLYALMAVCVLVMVFGLSHIWVLGVCVFLISYCVIGTHGMLSGTASMDFGGRKNVGTAVGLIDGLVYLGTGVQSLCLGFITESQKGWTFGGYFSDSQRGWSIWPLFLFPFAVIGAILAVRIWKAIPEAAKKRG
ncbi:MAG: MFS transporter [Candidatus Eisenbacteria bacterium]|uniref:MFS transporter n=1 Tax=Eiseniibacteriota bacterium TaxID=2212470 RepID=A0A948RVS6_UNCEI|nr:MFS transporter [Candidatus Eisenbacteria bacterium]MBU1948737.1 MFS transporter [Candidatus Eisenbacteria bacterium]MBU2690478.1 MFS transporter [Candidatus Eisenbacteria bacterium]